MFPFSSIPNPSTVNMVSTNRKTLSSIHWKGLVSMFGALITGVLLAVAHHLFYHYLNNRFVDEYFLSQAWVNNIATALTFLSKLMFVIAATTAYVQRQWLELAKSEHKIENVDTLTGIFDDISLFFKLKTWLKRPILLYLAIVIWSLPIASIFTPGALSVQASPYDNSTSVPVPTISYQDLHAWIQTQYVSGYVSPTDELLRIAMATSTSGQILNIPSTFQNQSYSMQFNGPALRCAVSPNQGLFGEALKAGVLNDTASGPWEQTIYIAFVPDDDRGLLGTNLTGNEIGPSDSGSYATLDQTSNDTARIYVMPGRLTYNTTKAALIQCELYNATYDLDFTFKFPYQTVHTNQIRYLNPVNATFGYCPVIPGANTCDSVVPHPYDHMSYQGVMDAFGHIIAGAESQTAPGDPTTSYNQTFATSRRLTLIDWESTESARQGLEQLFQNITLSTMSSASMAPSLVLPNSAAATVTTYPNVYKYSPLILLLSYGLSLLFSLTCTIVGLHSMWLNQASYQNQFSTFVRAAWNRNPNIDMWIKDSDQGADPLPKDVARARVKLAGACSFVSAPSLPNSTTQLNSNAANIPTRTLNLDSSPALRRASPSNSDAFESQPFV